MHIAIRPSPHQQKTMKMNGGGRYATEEKAQYQSSITVQDPPPSEPLNRVASQFYQHAPSRIAVQPRAPLSRSELLAQTQANSHALIDTTEQQPV